MSQVYDLLVEFENHIVGEIVLPIRHMLAGLPGTKIEEIECVYSHPQGLMQSARFLDEHRNWQQISVANTAIAAKKVRDEQDKSQAAVCSAYAAEVHGLEVLADNINDESGNCTRFIVVTNQKIFLKDASKNQPVCGTFSRKRIFVPYAVSFIYNDLNMTKIESRPIEGRNWEYRFFIDIEGNLADAAVKNAIRGLREEARSLRILEIIRRFRR